MAAEDKISRRRLYQQVADDIEGQIFRGEYKPDERLPSEQLLADEYGVSRNVIREALKRLKEHGLIYIRTGSGAYIDQPSTKPVADALNRFISYQMVDISLSDFYEIRRMIEPESARIAANRATEEDIQAIWKAYSYMQENQQDRELWSAADLQFHVAIAEATHNPLVKSILNPLTEPLTKVIAAGLYEPSGAQAGLDAHRKIIEAIENHNADAAYAAMLEHLVDSEERLSKIGFDLKDDIT
jgi:GntR family transcriptional repressor for pyruvate dehydrogenase complex